MKFGGFGRIGSMKPIKKTAFLISLMTAGALLAGCESARKVFGNEKTGPDEFAVYSRPPLSLPPDYRLRPPMPGTGRPQEQDTKNIAERAMRGITLKASRNRKPVQGSVGIQVLLRDTGGLDASPNIRTVLNEETSILSVQDQAFVDKLIFWVDEKPFEGTVVDAEKEQQRIRENQALGKPITEGETPQIKRKRSRKGLLDF